MHDKPKLSKFTKYNNPWKKIKIGDEIYLISHLLEKKKTIQICFYPGDLESLGRPEDSFCIPETPE